MPYLIAQCPTCLAEKMTFQVLSLTRTPHYHVVTSFCGSCLGPFVAWLKHNPSQNSQIGDLRGAPNVPMADHGYSVAVILPKPAKSSAPAHIPPGIQRVFLQAEENRSRQHFDAAGMAYRRSLELAVQDLDVAGSGSLKQRIDRLGAQGKITGEVLIWAHSIRTLGNEAAHDEAEPTAADIEDLSEFARVVLEYLYTLPERVKKHAPPPPSPAPTPSAPSPGP